MVRAAAVAVADVVLDDGRYDEMSVFRNGRPEKVDLTASKRWED
jgi:hypothetical protein